MNFLSVCSGIESASVAFEPMGWRAVGLAEIEPFPCSLLAHRFQATRPRFMPDPDAAADKKSRQSRISAIKTVSRLPETGKITNHGDITQFRQWTDVLPFRLLIGGTPCQSFSVAGLRQGLADPRGNLMLTYLAIAAEHHPEWLVWENVPGVLSADDGRAFGAFIKGLEELGYHAAWRVLDAQYVRVDGYGRAVPQRRRRVFVVGYLGDWRRAAGVLFDAESMSWNSPPRREARERVAFDAGDGAENCCSDIAPTLNAHFGSKQGLENQHIDGGCGLFVSHALSAEGHDASEDGTGRGTPIVAQTLTQGANSAGKDGYAGRRQEDDMNLVAFQSSQSGIREADTHATLDANNGSRRHNGVSDGYRVRRLMPVECERLQGFPDGWTDVPYRGRNVTPDGPRYRAIGNSKAVNVVRWIGRRIEMIERLYA